MGTGHRAGPGAACCRRPTWRETERCVWHADAAKTTADLAPHRTVPGERLDGAVLRGIDLSGVDLADCVLVDADLSGSNLRSAELVGADLRYATLDGADARNASFVYANLEEATLSNTDVRGATLQQARLHFAVLDARINRGTSFGNSLVYEHEAANAPDAAVRIERSEAALWTYRELRRLCDQYALVERTRTYYLREKEMQRRFSWEKEQYARALKLEGSRLVMRYGQSPWRVVGVSVGFIVACAVLYTITGFQETTSGVPVTSPTGDTIGMNPAVLLRVLADSLYFSIITFATVGYGDIKPLTGAARAIASVESLTGSLLMALLVFVLTRSST